MFMLCETDVLAREVLQKSISALPCCMGSIFLSSAPSVGARFLLFATPPQREGDCFFCFHFFNTSPARIAKINKIALRSYGLDVSARKSPKANRQQIVTFLPQVRSGRVFEIAKNPTNRFKNVCNTQGISTITT